MNDDFLTKFRTQPPREFSIALYASISQPKSQRNIFTLQNTVLVIATLTFVIACARVVTLPRWVEIGKIWVDVKSHILIPALPRMETVEPSNVQEMSYTLSDIEAAFEGEVKLPDWVPDGYVFDAVTYISNMGTDKTASLHWKGSTLQQHISLYAKSMKWWYSGLNRYTIGPATTFPVAPGSYRKVQVNGQPAVSIIGDWEINEVTLQQKYPLEVRWDKKAANQLYWIDGEWLYLLTASQDISKDNLIRMAESFK